MDDLTRAELGEVLDGVDYVADEQLLTTVFLALQMDKPLLVEGEPGSGKTELGKALAAGLDTELVRLQCYEGLTAEHALYEWNYTKQLLAIQSGERGVTETESVFSEPYLFERPLLAALTHDGRAPPVLLIDEVDRADEEFEALLLEVLSDFQVTIPEYGTISADRPPIVVITSNRTRPLSDALKRRCLYLHVQPPSFEEEFEIVRRKVPELDAAVAAEVVGAVQEIRNGAFLKQPGVAETLDWGRAIDALRADADDEGERSDAAISAADLERTIGTLFKEVEDVERIDTELLERVESAAREARDRVEQ